MSVLFFFSSFLKIGLCNSAANLLFDIFSFLTVDIFRVAQLPKISDHASVAASPEVFLSKYL